MFRLLRSPPINAALLSGLVLTGLSATTASAATTSEVQALASPDGRIQVAIAMPAPGSTDNPRWLATFRGQLVVAQCTLGLQIVGSGDVMRGASVLKQRRRSVNHEIPVLFGKADHADDHYNEIRFTVETPTRRRTEVVFRCYDDAIAFRYESAKGGTNASITIHDETTSFRLEGEPTAYAQYLENYKTSHEHNVTTARYSDLKPGALLDLPLTFAWDDGTFVAITEASLRHYAGMALMRSGAGASGRDLVCKLTPRPDGTKVVRTLPMQTPWRVVMIADRPGRLLESSTLYCLNDPPAFGDLSWIKPGKITFPWWNGDIYGGQRSAPILSFEMAKKYIDFCAAHGIPTHSMTSTEINVSPWYYQSKPGTTPGPDTDVTRPRDDFDLAAIRKYAQSKNVRLWTWVHQGALRGRVEEAFTAFEKLGWSGMMVDFFDHDDQETIEFAESILQAAARHHILIHLHGVWKPTGWQRTYPNLMNHEGALNLEYLKWGKQCTPEHNLMMAFTRLIAGPMDYHLGGFRAVPRAKFAPHNVAPNVLGSRGHHLAMYVCFDNPNPMVADDPAAYEAQPGFDFIQRVPTWWDETRVLTGEIGDVLVTARRKGKTWYVGGMSAGRARDLDLSLSFLNARPHLAKVWKDAPDADSDPNHLTVQAFPVTFKDQLRVHCAVDGGFVAELSPIVR